MIAKFQGQEPQISDGVFVAQGAQVVGNVIIGAQSSVWFNAVLRGDTNQIIIGQKTNIQDLCVVHTSPQHPVILGNDVTVGHRVVVHGCKIGNRVLVGMGSVLMDGVQIADDCIVAAGSLVTGNTKVPAGSLVMGSPAKVVRPLKADEYEWLKRSAQNYFELASKYICL